MAKMPDHFEMRGGSVLYVRSSPQSVLGIIFILFGIAALGIGTDSIPLDHSDDLGVLGKSAFSGFGLLFSLIGFYQAFWTTHTVLDRGRGVVVTRQGLFGWGPSHVVPLDCFTHVELGFTEGDSDSSDIYPISLLGAGDTPALALCRSYQLDKADAQSAYLSAFLGFPIVDRTLGEHAHVPDPYAKKNFSSHKWVLPVSSQLEIKDLISSVEIRLPPPPFAAAVVFPTSIPILFLVFMLWDQILRQPLTGVAIAALWMVMIVFGKWRRARACSSHGMVLMIGDQDISLQGAGRFAAHLKIPVSEIRSVALHVSQPDAHSWQAAWSNYILIQTPTDRHKIVQGLNVADTQFIYDIIKSVV